MNDRCVEYDVYVPVINAATGAEVLVRAIVHDHYISAEQVAELRLWAALPKWSGPLQR